MKWFNAILAACSIALFVPTMASAQPNHGGPGPNRGSAPVAAPSNPGHNNHGPDARNDNNRRDDRGPSSRPGDNRRDDRNHGPAAPAPGPNKAPVAPPPPAPKPGPAIPAPPAPNKADFGPRPGFDNRHLGMHNDDFKSYIKHVKRIKTNSDRVNYILSSRFNNWFTAKQVRDILKELPYESDRLKVACELYSKVVDPKNWNNTVVKLFSSWNRKKLNSCTK